MALVIAVASASSVQAGPVEFGGIGGLHTFAESSNLGVVTDNSGDPSPNATSLKNSALFGVRLGVYFTEMLGVEVEGGAIPTEPRSVLFDVWMVAARGQLIYQFKPKTTKKSAFVPFALAGAGAIRIVDVGATENENIIKKDDMKIAPYLGIGTKYVTGGGWGVRLDLRAALVSKADGRDGVPIEAEALLGLYKAFGVKPPKKEAPPPPKDDDPDKDGIVGDADKCPNDPEDKDGFEDDNGCPDPDNDADGVPDANDKCPLEAEDKDGFQDDDGCPDPDNDGDGIPDLKDKCVDQPETKNGFEDEDGCPDEVPETLKKFTGAIQGINFQVNSAALAPGANKVLDKAVAVLKEFEGVKLEIQGHTDDVPLRAGGKFADNMALSQARAETVKAYFVSKGIDEARIVAKGYGATVPTEGNDPTGLTGAKLNAARGKNRRVEFKLIANEATSVPPPPPPPPPPGQ